jgi:putative oxidoreductase
MLSLILGRFKYVEEKPLAYALVFGAAMLAIRVWLAMPFWSSGLTKWVSFPTQLGSSVQYLFANEFMLHLPGGPYPMPFPYASAWLSGMGEIILPIMLVAGFLSRPAALGILGMTLVIQLTIPDGWPVHIQWTGAALAILVLGPGMFSVDWLARKFVLGRG